MGDGVKRLKAIIINGDIHEKRHCERNINLSVGKLKEMGYET